MTWLWRALLLLFRADLRRRHGAEILSAIAAERQEPRYQGAIGAARHGVHTAADLLAAIVRDRRAGLHCPPDPGRQAKRQTHMDTFRLDLRDACRQLVRRPGFAAIAILSLALGIGGNTAVFGIVDSFVLHPFAFPDADRLLVIGPSFPKLSSDTAFLEVLSPLEYEDFRHARSFAGTAAFDLGNRNISGGDMPERVFTAFMIDDAFPVIGLRPLLGRGFTPDELRPNGPPAAVISHRLWRSRFHGDRTLVGRTIRVNGNAATLVGVMPPALLLLGTDLWIPWGRSADLVPRNRRQISAIARLAPDATARTADAELAAIAARVAADHAAQFPEYTGWRLVATPLASGVLQTVRPAGFLVLGAVTLVLFIACANLASLMLARATGRQRELAVRVALGAGRGRLAQQLLTEIAVLAAAGGLAGFAVAAIAIRASNSLLPAQLTAFGFGATVNLRVTAWCLLSALVALVLVGLFPVLQTGRADPNDSLKHDTRQTTAGRGARRARHGLIVGEIALAVMLALGAGLLLRSFVNLQRVDTGVDSHAVLTMRLTLPQEKYQTGEAMTAFFEELARRVDVLPSVGRVGLTSQFPPQEFFRTRVLVEGRQSSTAATLPTANATVASRGYFGAIGMRLRVGRTFDDRDRAGGPSVVVVNEAFVARHLAGRPPLGARLRLGDKPEQSPSAEVIGIVADTANAGAASAPAPEVFVPMEQDRDTWNQLFLVTRIAGDAMSAVPAIRQAVASIDPDQPVYAIQTLDQAFETSLLPQQASTVLLTIFAGVAIALAGVGIYGVTAYTVRSRTQEIGIRMAMGARRSAVMTMVLREVLVMVTLGLAIGVGAVLALGPLLSSVLFGVSAIDPLTVAATAGMLGAVAVAAAWRPAAVASRVDPVVALRYE